MVEVVNEFIALNNQANIVNQGNNDVQLTSIQNEKTSLNQINNGKSPNASVEFSDQPIRTISVNKVSTPEKQVLLNQVKNPLPQKNKNGIKIIFDRKDKKDNYIFRILPSDTEVARSLRDIHNLRASLALEFPFYYVVLEDPSR